MTPNQQAVLHFLDALKKYYPDLTGLVNLIQKGNLQHGVAFISTSIPSLPLTWVNQARQCAILLKGDQQ